MFQRILDRLVYFWEHPRPVPERIKERFPFLGFPFLLAVTVALVVGVFALVIGLGSGGSGPVFDKGIPRLKNARSENVTWTSGGEPNYAAGDTQEDAGGQASAAQAATEAASPQAALQQVVPQASSAQTGELSAGGDVPGRESVFVFHGYGRAHGVGLCMDGVKYRALAGQSYIDIINSYYTGVTFTQVDEHQPIRVKGRDGQIRTLPMNEYLYHLVEEPDDYPAEGLKVLYVAARTYTLSCIARGKHASQGFDICSSGDCCQAFDENKTLAAYPNSIAAVDATAGQALFYNGSPIIAAYCGSCGGHTDNNEDVWGGAPIPYLRGVADPYCAASPRFCATAELSVSGLEGKLSAAGSGVGQLKLVDLSNRTPGGRVKVARLVGTSGTREISGLALAKILGFSGTRFDYTFR